MYADEHLRMVQGVNIHSLVIILSQAVIHLSKHIVYHITFLDQPFHPHEMSLRVGDQALYELVQTIPFIARSRFFERIGDVFC